MALKKFGTGEIRPDEENGKTAAREQQWTAADEKALEAEDED